MYPSYLEYFRERDSSSLVDFDYDRNLFEFEQNSALPVLKGRLRSCFSYWHTIGAKSFVIDTIKFGYRIPFISTPCQARFSNNQSAVNNASFVESAIAELVHTHAVVEVPFIPHVVNPLSVSIQSSGKKRLILDLRHVNHFIWKQKFRCEDWRVLLSYVNKGDYLFSFDLKSGYHHIDIFPDHQTFLGFSWVFSGTVRYFCFASLPFGLSSAPYVFTKCLRPLVKFWRSNGIKIVVFLDDGCGKGDSLPMAKENSLFVQSSLSSAGFVANSAKSLWNPTQVLVWLGLNWDLVIGTISIIHRRIYKFIALIDKFLLSAPYVTARDCAVIAGNVMSMSPVLGNLTRLKTRFLYKVIESRRSWDSRFNIGLHNDCLSEIFFWKNNIVSLNTRPILPYNAPLLFSYSDASNVACGAFVVGTNEVSHRMWTACEAAKSSTWRELKAIQFALSAFKALVRGKCVKWHSDSQGAVRVVEIGSPRAEFDSIALDIFYFCRTYNITLIPQWVPRELNACADAISHIVDFDDGYTTPAFFAHLDHLWGPHTVDRFANAANAHLPRFNSRFRVPGTEAVDAFSISWNGENNWLVPPVHCITRAVQHLLVCGAVGTLVVPYWPSNVFCSFLFANAIQFQPYVLEYIHFPDPSGIFALGCYKDSLIGSDRFNSAVLAVRIGTKGP